MAKSIFEEMGGTYTQVGDYFIPCLTLPVEKEISLSGYGGSGICDISRSIRDCCMSTC